MRPARPALVLGIVVLGVVAFLYARPIASYSQTRDQLSARKAEVDALRTVKARFAARVDRSSTVEVLARDARRIGQVRPGEQLFIVKGLDAWRTQHADDAR
jgi:cell division protein FtsB